MTKTGRYRSLAQLVREAARATGLVLVVVGGDHGDGAEALVPDLDKTRMATFLRDVADDLEREDLPS